MSTSKVHPTLRMAIWIANNFKCWYCDEVIALNQLNIEHLIPESIDTFRFEELRKSLSLPEEFHVNDTVNLVPSHWTCNQRKGASELSESALTFYFELSKAKQAAIVREYKRLSQQKASNRLMTNLVACLENGSISPNEVINAVDSVARGRSNRYSEPLVVSFGISFSYTDSNVAAYVYACEQYEKRLAEILVQNVISPHIVTEEQRTGETISIRVAFWHPNLSILEQLNLEGWKILEILPFSNIYSGSWDELYARAAIRQYQAIMARDSDRCPSCGRMGLVQRRVTHYGYDEEITLQRCERCGWEE